MSGGRGLGIGDWGLPTCTRPILKLQTVIAINSIRVIDNYVNSNKLPR